VGTEAGSVLTVVQDAEAAIFNVREIFGQSIITIKAVRS